MDQTPKTILTALITTLWTIAILLGIAGTASNEVRFRFWALLIALAATSLTMHLEIACAGRRERRRVEQLVRDVLDGMKADIQAGAADIPRRRT